MLRYCFSSVLLLLGCFHASRADVVTVISNLNQTYAGATDVEWNNQSMPTFTISFATNGSSGSGRFNTLSLLIYLPYNPATLTAFSAKINGGITRNATLTSLTPIGSAPSYRADFDIADLTYTTNTSYSWALGSVTYAGTGITGPVNTIYLQNTNGNYTYATGFQGASTNYNGAGNVNNIQFAVSVPEPGTLTLGSLALLAGGGAVVRRYRKRRQAETEAPSNHDKLKNAE